jgi:hypothetical protein
MVEILWHRRGNQAANGENKPQPVISGETGLLESKKKTPGVYGEDVASA